MPEHILFLTGKLAEKNLHRVLEGMQPTDFTYDVQQLGVSVAALMTTDMIQRRLKDTRGADRIIIPGRCRGDINSLAKYLNIPVERGPEELKDLPSYFGKQALQADLTKHNVLIFAEIVDAPKLTIEEILEQAAVYRADGADVIDIGCLPNTPFPHLQRAISTLKDAGCSVSIDSLESEDLIQGAEAGADYLLSLTEDSLWIADRVDAIPILIPVENGNLDSLYNAIATMQGKKRTFIADTILDPIHFGFTESISRYLALRHKYPDIEMMMGIGNLTELTHVDTSGINALLLGMISEMNINYLLTTQVSAHCRKAVCEADLARRIMYNARQNSSPPQHIDDGLIGLHELKPVPYDFDEIQETARGVKDGNFRIQVSEHGIHIYNRDGLHTSMDPFELYPLLNVEEDGAHAFYLGVELARAQIAYQLGKRYVQDEELKWGCAVEQQQEDLLNLKQAGPTLRHKRRK